MHGVEQELLFLPAALMPSNQLIFKDDFYFVDSGHHRNRSVSELRRYGIIIAVEADQRQ